MSLRVRKRNTSEVKRAKEDKPECSKGTVLKGRKYDIYSYKEYEMDKVHTETDAQFVKYFDCMAGMTK